MPHALTFPYEPRPRDFTARLKRRAPRKLAQRMQRRQALNHGTTMTAHAVRSGDSHGSGSSVNLSESDRS